MFDVVFHDSGAHDAAGYSVRYAKWALDLSVQRFDLLESDTYRADGLSHGYHPLEYPFGHSPWRISRPSGIYA
jgi:hypothetical protein